MKDPYTHVEKTPVPGFGQVAIADLISRAIGLAPDLPKTVGTGCGKRRRLSDTTTVPEKVTCLACADYGRQQQIDAAENAELLISLGDDKLATLATPGKPALTVADLRQLADGHRETAARYPRALGRGAGMNDDAWAIAGEFGLDPGAVRAYLHRLAISLAADPEADVDELVARFEKDSRAFEARYYDRASCYTGAREGLREAITHEAYTLIREAASGQDPRRVAYRLSGRRAAG